MALQLPDDLAFHRTNWRAERLGWCLILAIVVIAITGLAGRGPLGETRVSSETLTVEYDRIMRNDAPGTITIRLSSPATRDSLVYLWSSQEVLHGCSPSGIVPLPDQIITGGDRTIFRIRILAGADSVAVALRCLPRKTGVFRGAIGIVDGRSVQLRTVVLP